MKKLHLATSNDCLRPVMQYIQVKNGFCYATDCHILVKVPINEVFGNNVFDNLDWFYINGKEWKNQKMYKATRFEKKDNILIAYDNKGNKIGMLDFIRANDFQQKIGMYPDCEMILPTEDKPKEDLSLISFNPTLYARIGEALEETCQLFNLTFFGQRKAILIKHNKPEEFTKGIAVMMPLAIF